MIESYPIPTTIGIRIIAKGMASSPIPNTAPPKENRRKTRGISSASDPLVFLIILSIPASTALVFKIIPKAPPVIRINAIIPTAVPHLSPLTRPSKI